MLHIKYIPIIVRQYFNIKIKDTSHLHYLLNINSEQYFYIIVLIRLNIKNLPVKV